MPFFQSLTIAYGFPCQMAPRTYPAARYLAAFLGPKYLAAQGSTISFRFVGSFYILIF